MRNMKRGPRAVVCLIGFWLGAGLTLAGWSEERRSVSTTAATDRLDPRMFATATADPKRTSEEGDQLDLAVLGFASSPALQVDTLNLRVLDRLTQCAPLPPLPTAAVGVTSASVVHVASPAGDRNGVLKRVGGVKTASERSELADDAQISDRPVNEVSTSETSAVTSPVSPSPRVVLPAALDPPAIPSAGGKGTWPAGTRFWWWEDRRYHDRPEPGTVYNLPGSSSLMRCQNGRCYWIR